MKKQLNVGVDLDQFDQFRYLPRRWLMEHSDVTINLVHIGQDQHTPRLHNSSFEGSTDSIDLYLHPAAKATNAIVPLINHYSMQLWEKPTQLSYLHRLRATTKNSDLDKFEVQNYVCVIPNSERQQAKRQFSQMQMLGDRFVLRPNLGANGLGVKIIEGDLVPKTAAELNSVEWIQKVASNQAELDKYATAGFHFCELIEDAVEVRIVRSRGRNLLIAPRTTKATNNSLGLELGRVAEGYTVTLADGIVGLPIECHQVTALLSAVDPMQRSGSYDLWVKPDGSFGLFEFSSQFALNCCEPTLRESFMKIYLEDFVNEYIDDVINA